MQKSKRNILALTRSARDGKIMRDTCGKISIVLFNLRFTITKPVTFPKRKRIQIDFLNLNFNLVSKFNFLIFIYSKKRYQKYQLPVKPLIPLAMLLSPNNKHISDLESQTLSLSSKDFCFSFFFFKIQRTTVISTLKIRKLCQA